MNAMKTSSVRIKSNGTQSQKNLSTMKIVAIIISISAFVLDGVALIIFYMQIQAGDTLDLSLVILFTVIGLVASGVSSVIDRYVE